MNLIYLTVEVKSRELISKLFFIGNNIKEKFYFVIGDKLAIKRATNLFGKGVYFYKSLNKNDTNHIKRIKKREIFIYHWMKKADMHCLMILIFYLF